MIKQRKNAIPEAVKELIKNEYRPVRGDTHRLYNMIKFKFGIDFYPRDIRKVIYKFKERGEL